MLSSRLYFDLNPSSIAASETSAQRNAGSPARRGASITWASLLLIASKTNLTISRTDAPRPVPTLMIAGIGFVALAATRCAAAISRTST